MSDQPKPETPPAHRSRDLWKELLSVGVSVFVAVVIAFVALGQRIVDEAREHRAFVNNQFSHVLQETAYLRGLLEERASLPACSPPDDNR